MAPRVRPCGTQRLASTMRPRSTYGVPCALSKKRPRRGPFQKPGTTSNTAAGGRSSRMSCAGVLH
eukprot:5162411-Alexandrium_andersonii.AAC.1